jgi:hypothetical protein
MSRTSVSVFGGRQRGERVAGLGHASVEMVYRRYHRFIPNLRGRDGINATRGLATGGVLSPNHSA